MASRIFTKASSRSFLADFAYYSFAIASWVPAVIFFNNHVGQTATISGYSMYPYLNTSYNESMTRDICWKSKRAPLEGLQRGMLVSFKSPYNPEVTAVKRVIALPGDIVTTRAPYPLPTAIVPQGHIWVEGDNRDGKKTLDSNHYGPISMNLVEGRITHVLWPWASRGRVRWEEWKGRGRVIKRSAED